MEQGEDIQARELRPDRLGDPLDRLYRAAWALCGSPTEAEDLVQEMYARVLARPRLLRRDDELGYLMRALRNTFFSQRRTAGRRPIETPEEEGDRAERGAAPAAAEIAEAREVYRVIADRTDSAAACTMLGRPGEPPGSTSTRAAITAASAAAVPPTSSTWRRRA